MQFTAPTLVGGGTEDPFYSAELFRETAAGIPNARLALYEGKGHAMLGKDFQREVQSFLAAGDTPRSDGSWGRPGA